LGQFLVLGLLRKPVWVLSDGKLGASVAEIVQPQNIRRIFAVYRDVDVVTVGK
jgi:hypothetical protein